MDLIELKDIAATCNLCELCSGRVKPVFARGSGNSDILICGMCPGKNENLKGVPFVGPAGKILDAIISYAFTGFTIDPYITNLVKCFVNPGISLNDAWMGSCLPYFVAQIGMVKPKTIILLGGDVCQFVLNTDVPIKNLRGNVYEYIGTKVVCSYHPSFLARQGGEKSPYFKKVVEDFKLAL